MKTSNVLASLLFSSIAAAIPVNRRALVTKTELVVETVVVYTTVWDGQVPAATEAAVTSVYVEEPQQPSSAEAKPTSTPAYTPPVVEQPSSTYTPPPSSSPTPTPTPEPSSVFTPAPEPSSVYTPAPVPSSSEAPAFVPEPSSVYTPAPAPSSVTPVPVASSAAPVAPAAPVSSSAPSSGSDGGNTYTGDLTVYDTAGAAGACGSTLSDDMMIVALAANLMGPSTYNVMTGDATNPYCGKEVTISYGGKTVKATIQDKCPGCAGDDLDLSRAVWKAIGMTEDTRVKGTWSVAL